MTEVAATEPVLAARDLSRRFGDRWLFRGLSFSVAKGEVVAIRGPSGSGKTLLLRLLAWLDAPHAGDVTLCGKTPAQLGVPAFRARVAFVSQTPPVLEGTPSDLVKLLSTWRAPRARPMGDAQAQAETWSLEPGAFSRPWRDLSGGERQRCHLAIALATAPDVLLLDEPTSALDHDSASLVEDTLRGQTAIWVTHDDEQAARVADRSVHISREPAAGPPS